MNDSKASTLAQHLGHVDRRVRQKAQLELATRKEVPTLSITATDGASVLARLHGIWGLGQISRANPAMRDNILQTLLPLAGDKEVELRAHATRLLGEIGGPGVSGTVRQNLRDRNLRVRYFALMAAHNLANNDAFATVLDVIAENAGRDPIVRHGGFIALTTVASAEQLTRLTGHSSEHVRLAAVVALRRLRSPAVAEFLNDEQPLLVAEAVRAIHDVPIRDAFPQLH